MKVAIYEPEPRICGPDSWAAALRSGFRALGHETHVVTFTRNGKTKERWGRVERAKGSSMSCALTVDCVGKLDDDGELLNSYDLVILTDVKTASHDKRASDAFDPWPEYVEVLRQTRTRWTSALHGRWYYLEDEAPTVEGRTLSAASGSPFIDELIRLENFSGFLLTHARDFDRYSKTLRAVQNKALCPLPYALRYATPPEPVAELNAFSVMGRIVPTKHRHVLNEMMTRGMWRDGIAIYGGAVTCTHGPSQSFEMAEALAERGWKHNWGDDGVRKTKPFIADGPYGNKINYIGAYTEPSECATKVHVGITDCDFSGGLLEFATLEAIDCGMMPVITAPFVPHTGTQCALYPIQQEYRSFTPKRTREAPDVMFSDIADVMRQAYDDHSPELVAHNRSCIAEENCPARIAQLIIEGSM